MSTEEEDFVQTTEDVIKDRLLHVLTIYPGISPSMLQVGIGTAISPKMWHPVMAKLREMNAVREEETFHRTPNGRDLNYKKLFVNDRTAWNKPEELKSVPGRCPDCGAFCQMSPGGIVCLNGHGGIDPVI